MGASLGLGILLAYMWTVAPAEAPAPAPAEAPPVDPERAAARDAVTQARAAAASGDYATALQHYERALSLRPSAALHYNIAVCHHRMMLQTPAGAPAHEASRSAAVASYDAYLKNDREAPDRVEVEQTIISLGGRPSSLVEQWRIDEPAPAAAEPQLRNDTELEPPAVPSVPAPPTERRIGPTAHKRGRVGFGLFVGITDLDQLLDSDDVVDLPIVGGAIRGDGFLGPQQRVALGAELGFYGQPTRSNTRHSLTGGHLDVVSTFEQPLGRERRFEIAAGGLLGLGWQTLQHYGTTTTTCAITEGRRVSVRGGVRVGARLGFVFLLGRKKNHELALRLTPALLLWAEGSKRLDNDACAEVPTPFEQVGLADAPSFVATFDIGYAPRF